MPRARFSTGWGIRRDRKAQRGSGAGGSGGGGLGNPSSILGALLHADFDAADPGITLGIGTVASIPNRGNDTASMVQATAANQPAFSATSFAGGPGMTFDGVDDGMLCTFAAPIPIGRRPMLWVVFQALSTVPSDKIVASMEDAAAARYMVFWSNRNTTSNFAAAMAPAGGAPGQITFSPTDVVNAHLAELADTVNGVQAFALDGVVVDGGPAGSFSALTLDMGKLRLGNYNGSQFSNCKIRRVIVANDLPSAAQISAMRAYLRAQPYGLTF